MNLQTTEQSDDDANVCSEFVEQYGEYADGTLDAAGAERLQRHVEACASCARYDRIIRRGAELARDFLSVEPSPDFEQRLQHRIFHEQDTAVLSGGRPAAAATALAVAAAIALLAWSPLLVQDESAPPASSASVELSAPAPLTGTGTWYRVPTTSTSASLAAFPGPHSPLIVTPPAHRRVRTVSAEYAPVE